MIKEYDCVTSYDMCVQALEPHCSAHLALCECSRAQSYDSLSSMANIAGYRSVTNRFLHCFAACSTILPCLKMTVFAALLLA